MCFEGEDQAIELANATDFGLAAGVFTADLARAQELVEMAKRNYVEHKLIHTQLTERETGGVSRRSDVEQALGRLALAESNLLTEVSNLHDVGARYLRLVGEAPAAALPALPDALAGTAGLPPTVADAVKAALGASPALNAAIENVRAGQAEIDARWPGEHVVSTALAEIEGLQRQDVAHPNPSGYQCPPHAVKAEQLGTIEQHGSCADGDASFV